MNGSILRFTGGCLCGLLLPALEASAEQSAPIIVTATRTAEIADQTLAPVIVITRAQIERSQPLDVPELLRFHAGLDIGRNGGPGQPASLFIRGTDSNHTLVMIDGVRINPGTIGGAAIQNLDPALIERIEIVKGPRSALYGSEAIGGVVNIITRRAASGTHARATAQAGSFGTREITAGADHGAAGTRFGVDVADFHSDGFPPRSASSIDRGQDNTSLNAYAGTRLGSVDLDLSHSQAVGTTEYLDFFLSPIDEDFRNSVTALTLAANPGAAWSSRLQLSRARDELDQNQSADFAHTRRDELDWQNDIVLDAAQTLTAGVWLAREDISALSFGTGFDERTDINAVYLQDDIAVGPHRLLLAARHSHHDAFGSHVTWDAEYGYRISDATRASLAAGTAFRAPDSTDRFGFGGNPALDPETARNLELGLHHALAPGQQLSVNAFYDRIEDLIEYDFNTSQSVNIGRADIRGVETAYELALDHWHARLEATIQNPHSVTTGDPLPRRARRSATAGLVYSGARYELGADMLFTGRRKDSDFSDVTLGGYGLVNLTASLRLRPAWTLRGKIENLFDKDYVLADGFNTAERSYYAQLAYQWEAAAP